MKSCLYECSVLHARFAPKAHRFAYRIFLFSLDLDELEHLPSELSLFGVDRTNFYSFRDRDYLPTDEPVHNGRVPPGATTPGPRRLKERVVAYAASQGVDLANGRVELLTLPRIFGYGFNPVSFYFCRNGAGEPVATIAEVTNTFREVKPYFLGPNCRDRGDADRERGRTAFHLRIPKEFYVSPFSALKVEFDFRLCLPDKHLTLQIDDYAGTARMLTSTLTGSRRELTNRRLLWFLVKYPCITLLMMGRIHWHALQLWWKRLPWFAKAAGADDQRQLYRPHRSVLAATPTQPKGAGMGDPVLSPPLDSA